MVLKAPTGILILNEAVLALDTVWVDGVQKSFTIDTTTGDLHHQASDPCATRVIRLHIADPLPPTPGNRAPERPAWLLLFHTPTRHRRSSGHSGYTMSEPSDATILDAMLRRPVRKRDGRDQCHRSSGLCRRIQREIAGNDGKRQWDGHVALERRPSDRAIPHVRDDFKVVGLDVSFRSGPRMTRCRCSTMCSGPIRRGLLRIYPRCADDRRVQSAVWQPIRGTNTAMSAVTPFGFGGMEHQSMTTLLRGLETSETVVAHELAHQWWGDLVTCGTWADIWLNESFATYSEAIWHEHLGGFDELKDYMQAATAFQRRVVERRCLRS